MGAIESCRTAALGGRLFQCGRCGRQHPIQNSCRDRHCPNCQGAAARKWMKRRTCEILPVPYFHLVFTMPREIAGIGLRNRRLLITILFRAAHETVRTIAADPRHGGRRIGGTSVLHTWDQQMRFHPHLHLVVPNAGIDAETGKWTVGSDRFLAPVKVLASLFRRRFLEQLARAGAEGRISFAGGIGHLARPEAFRDAVAAARSKAWVVYAKRPFRGPEQVFAYLSRYTHRVAIGDSRILGFDGEKVRIRCRKPKLPGRRKPRYGTTGMSAETFIDRFLLHVLPSGTQRIRHFGILANNCRAANLRQARDDLGIAKPPLPERPARTEADDRDDEDAGPIPCPHCGGVLRALAGLPAEKPTGCPSPDPSANRPRAPPKPEAGP